MSEHEKAEQARKGLVDSIKGKAKEIVGAVTGSDSLTAEGQLEQTQAEIARRPTASRPLPTPRRSRPVSKQQTPGSQVPKRELQWPPKQQP